MLTVINKIGNKLLTPPEIGHRKFALVKFKIKPNFAAPINIYARMAELVDALVSKTSSSNRLSVRSRLRVLNQSECGSEHFQIVTNSAYNI